MLTELNQIRSIVFDLDGTLYANPGMLGEITATAEDLVANTRGIGLREARNLILKAKARLAETLEDEPTLTRTCLELGIPVADLHQAFQDQIRPERYLVYDPVLQALLDSLRQQCDLYIYTNNNLPLTQKILALLGVDNLFGRLFTIEFTWVPKPDLETVRQLLEEIGGPPESFLFIGDRHSVDLKLPDSLGIPTLKVRETADLLQIHKLLGLLP